MSYEKVAKATNLIIGTKQTMKALNDGLVYEVIMASDADRHITYRVEQLAKSMGVPIVYVYSMKKLGEACGIDVGAATVALKK